MPAYYDGRMSICVLILTTWVVEVVFARLVLLFDFQNCLVCVRGDTSLFRRCFWCVLDDFRTLTIEAVSSSLTDRMVSPAEGVSGCYLYNKVFGYGAHRSTSVTLFDHLPATKNVVLCRSSARGMPGRNVFYRLRGTAMVSRCVCSDPRRLSSFLFFDATATRNFE